MNTDLKDLMNPLNTWAPSISQVAGLPGFSDKHLLMWVAKLWLSEDTNGEHPELPNDDEKFHRFLWEPVPVVEIDHAQYACPLLKIAGIKSVNSLIDRAIWLAGDNVHLSIQGFTRDIVLDYLETERAKVAKRVKEIIEARSVK